MLLSVKIDKINPGLYIKLFINFITLREKRKLLVIFREINSVIIV